MVAGRKGRREGHSSGNTSNRRPQRQNGGTPRGERRGEERVARARERKGARHSYNCSQIGHNGNNSRIYTNRIEYSSVCEKGKQRGGVKNMIHNSRGEFFAGIGFARVTHPNGHRSFAHFPLNQVRAGRADISNSRRAIQRNYADSTGDSSDSRRSRPYLNAGIQQKRNQVSNARGAASLRVAPRRVARHIAADQRGSRIARANAFSRTLLVLRFSTARILLHSN